MKASGTTPQKHLTQTSVHSGYPICGAPLSAKLPGSLHAAYWHADEHGRDFCPACVAIMDEIDAELDSPATIDRAFDTYR